MPLNENDLSFLIDIVDCIMDINEFTKEIGFYEFEKDKMRKLAVERQLFGNFSFRTTLLKIARLVQVLGAGVDYNDTRVAAQFARSVIEKKDIVLKTEGKTRRPCIYTRDAVAGICTVLLKGISGEAYSVANADTIATIRETAEMIAHKIANNSIKVVLDIDVPAEYAPNLNLNRVKSLGWEAEIGLEEAYRRMIESMRERKNGVQRCNI